MSSFAAEEYTNRIAHVTTRQSFLNVVVNVLTGGIVSPMEVQVESAAAGATADAGRATGGPEEIGATIREAAFKSAETGAPVYINFTE